MSEWAFYQSQWSRVEVEMSENRAVLSMSADEAVETYNKCYCSKGNPCDRCVAIKLHFPSRFLQSFIPEEAVHTTSLKERAANLIRQDAELLERAEERHKKRVAGGRIVIAGTVELIEQLGGNTEAVLNTPTRFLKALDEMTAGRHENPAEILAKQFEEHSDEVVILRGIEFTSLCEHHLLPFVGTADVGYIPGTQGKVVGLSKLARLVDCFARRLQLQERMCREIADSLMTHLCARGAAVVLRAHHSCMGCRGVRKGSAEMVTSCMRGLFRENGVARSEFLMLCREGGGG